MAKLFRRTWERQRFGRNGAISSPLPTRTGTDGVISGAAAAFAGPVKVFTSATASFVTADIGRKIRLTSTPGTGRYDAQYVIDSINSATSVNLRMNHNVGGTPTSDAMFYENGTTIVWKILESCTFTADQAGDIEDFYPGSCIFIDSTTAANKGLWLISHRIDSQTVVLCKSYVWFMTSNAPPTYLNLDASVGFTAQTTLRWYVIDRQVIGCPDWWEVFVQFCIDTGWSMYQQRGVNAGNWIQRDVILKSTGESDSQIPGGKAMYFRYVHCANPNSLNITNRSTVAAAMYQHWDPVLTASSPGQGSGGMTLNNGTLNVRCAQGGGDFMNPDDSPAWVYGPFFQASQNWNRIGRGGLPEESIVGDYSMFGDRDEMQIAGFTPGAGGNTSTHVRMGFGWLKVMGANSNVVTVINNVTVGINKDLNTGTVNVATLTPPYSVGDNITVAGKKTSNPAEFVETTTIVGFDNTDPSNRLVRVANLSMAFGNGPDTLKLQIGEDPLPIFGHMESGATVDPIIHNLGKFGNNVVTLGSPGRDTQSQGFVATQVQIWSGGFAELDPNRKTGRYGLLAIGLKHVGNGEFRGRMHYNWEIPDYRWTIGAKLVVDGTDVYVHSTQFAGSTAIAYGPMSKAMAGIYT